jgi:hypothetical protein
LPSALRDDAGQCPVGDEFGIRAEQVSPALSEIAQFVHDNLFWSRN